MANRNATARDVANWMLDWVLKHGELHQTDAVGFIRQQFGARFVYLNNSGGESINKDVLKAFNAISKATVVYVRGAKYWRKRFPYDAAGRQQES